MVNSINTHTHRGVTRRRIPLMPTCLLLALRELGETKAEEDRPTDEFLLFEAVRSGDEVSQTSTRSTPHHAWCTPRRVGLPCRGGCHVSIFEWPAALARRGGACTLRRGACSGFPLHVACGGGRDRLPRQQSGGCHRRGSER